MNNIIFLFFLLSFSSFGSVIPQPRFYQVGKKAVIQHPEIAGDLHPLVQKKLKTLTQIKTSNETGNFEIRIRKPVNHYPVFRTDESYEIKSSPKGIVLTSQNEYGALHGLETLRQLLSDFDGKLPAMHIKDSPRYPWRGLLIDVARQWISLETLRQQIDLMAKVKFNVLHLHLSDDQAFRVESKNFPRLHSNNNDGKFYTQDEIRELIAYASERGIRTIPEFDVPGHVSAINAAYPEVASKVLSDKPSLAFGPQEAALHPFREETYRFLNSLFREMGSLFPDEYFHVGGDEVSGKHWLGDEGIVAQMKENNLKDLVELQFMFTRKIEAIVKGMNKKMLAWDEVLKDGGKLDSAIQVWRDPKHALTALSKKMPVIYSYGFYLDLQLPTSFHYLNDPEEQLPRSPYLWGGEACLWAERVTDRTISNRIWPRAMAVAERLWSDKKINDVRDFYDRQIGLARTFGIYENLILEKIMTDSAEMNVSAQTLGEFFSWLEPGKFYSQHRYRTWNASTIQNQWVDVLPTESLKTTMLTWVFEDWLKKRSPEKLRIVEETLASLATLSTSLVSLQDKNYPEKEELVQLGKDLGGLSRIAQDALHFLAQDRVRPGRQWLMENRTRLGMFGQIRAGMQLGPHLLTEQMVHLVAQKYHLPAR